MNDVEHLDTPPRRAERAKRRAQSKRRSLPPESLSRYALRLHSSPSLVIPIRAEGFTPSPSLPPDPRTTAWRDSARRTRGSPPRSASRHSRGDRRLAARPRSRRLTKYPPEALLRAPSGVLSGKHPRF